MCLIIHNKTPNKENSKNPHQISHKRSPEKGQKNLKKIKTINLLWSEIEVIGWDEAGYLNNPQITPIKQTKNPWGSLQKLEERELSTEQSYTLEVWERERERSAGKGRC